MPGALGVHECEGQRVNGPLCRGMNGAPEEGDTHQLALMTSHFLQKHTHESTHEHMLAHAHWHLPKEQENRDESFGGEGRMD